MLSSREDIEIVNLNGLLTPGSASGGQDAFSCLLPLNPWASGCKVAVKQLPGCYFLQSICKEECSATQRLRTGRRQAVDGPRIYDHLRCAGGLKRPAEVLQVF